MKNGCILKKNNSPSRIGYANTIFKKKLMPKLTFKIIIF